MPAETPAVAVTLIEQAARAHADLVGVGDFEARVMVTGAVARDKSQQVMVAAAFAAAQECDDVLRAIRQPHADDARIKIDLPLEIGRETQRVAEAPRLHRQVARGMACYADAIDMPGLVDSPFRRAGIGRSFRNPHVEEHAVRIAKPQPVTGRFRRRIQQPRAVVHEPRLESRECVGARTEA